MYVLLLGRGGSEYAARLFTVREIMFFSHSFVYKIQMVITKSITSNLVVNRMNFKQPY